MGQVIARFRMWSLLDEPRVRQGEILPIEVEAIVDTGTFDAVLPTELSQRLGLVQGDEITIRFGDGSTVRRRLALGLRLESHGRNAECRAILEPGRSVPLVGQSFLEATCLLVDGKAGRLVPDPSFGGEEIHEVLSAAR